MSTGIGVGISGVFKSRPAGGPSVVLEYAASDYCKLGGTSHAPTIATPAGGLFTDDSPTGADFQVNGANGAFNVGASTPGNYTITYTVTGVGFATFPINIGAVIDTTITGDSDTCVGVTPSPADLTAVAGYSNYEWFKDNVSVQSGASNTYTPAFNVAGSFVYKVTITDNSLSTPCEATSNNFTFTVNAVPATPTISGSDFCSGQSTTLTATPITGTFVWEVNTGSGYNVISGESNNTISVSTAGDYRTKVTAANGCNSDYSNVLSITQFASPTVTITTAPGTTICTGDTATLTANVTGGTGTISYAWSTGDTSEAISVTTTGTYTVTVTDSNGCTATASQLITASTAATTIASINNAAAMSFNGTDTYIGVGNDSSLSISGDASFSMWVKLTSLGSFRALLSKRVSDTSRNYEIMIRNTNNISFYSGPINSAKLTSSSTVPLNTWTHIAVVVSGNNINSYFNGVKDSVTGTLTGGLTSGVEDLFIGVRSLNGVTDGLEMIGSMDEIAIWNTALSSCDVKGIYEGSIGSNAGKAANLLDANTTIPAPVYWNRMGDS